MEPKLLRYGPDFMCMLTSIEDIGERQEIDQRISSIRNYFADNNRKMISKHRKMLVHKVV